MQPPTLLRVSHNSGARGAEAVEGRVADLDRCLYGDRNVQLQLDAEGVSGRACADPCLGLPDGIAQNGFAAPLYLSKTATSGARSPPIQGMTSPKWRAAQSLATDDLHRSID